MRKFFRKYAIALDLRWTGCALIAFGASELGRSAYVISSQWWACLAWIIGGLLIATTGAAREYQAVTWKSRLGLSAAMGGVALALQLPLDRYICTQPRIEVLGWTLARILSAVTDVIPGGHGALLANSSEGALTFAPTAELFGVRAWTTLLACILIVLVSERRARLLGGAIACLAIVLTAEMHAGVKVLRFLAVDQVLANMETATLAFSRPVELIVLMLLASLVIQVLLSELSRNRTADVLPQGGGYGPIIMAVLGACLLSFGLSVYTRGPSKPGRVLIDEQMGETWEPSARRLDFGWYGDMSTYSFSSIVEFLGYHYATSLNESRPYDDGLLKDYDVLVIRTPRRWMSVEEEQAILRFVRGGGGLLLIGDHTNLMGMNTRLNRLAEPAGLHFRYDSVMNATDGGFSRFIRPSVLPHPALGSARDVEFMTGCSIAVSGSAEPIMVVPDQVCVDHDYSRNSFFGSIHSDPSCDHGPIVLAASAVLGEGRVVAFADSTIFSSFAVFLWDRERLFMGFIDFLNTRAGGGASTHALALCGLVLLSLAAWNLRLSGASVTAALAIAVWIGVPVGLLASKGLSMVLFRNVVAVRKPPRLNCYVGDCEAFIPPVIGDFSRLDMDWCYDTLYASLPRAGVFPRPCKTLEESLTDDAMLILNPDHGIVNETDRQRYIDWVHDGGNALLAIRSDHFHIEPINSYIDPYGMTVAVGAESPDAVGDLLVQGAERHTHFSSGAILYESCRSRECSASP